MKTAILDPFFSIIIPTFNSVNLISIALDSVISQSFTNYEVLIFDNASSDGTIEIIKNYIEKDARIRLISEKDNGIYDAMNKGISIAQGTWIFFLGYDDSFYNDEVLMNVARNILKTEEVRFVYGNVKHYKLFQNPLDFTIYDGRFDGDKLLQKNICHQAIFYHYTLFTEFGLFKTKYKLMADWDFNLRCFNKVKSLYLDIIISNFYAGGRSAKQDDEVFYNELLANLIFQYPYHYTNKYFYNRRKLLTHIVQCQIRRLNFFKAFKASKVLVYHLSGLHKN